MEKKQLFCYYKIMKLLNLNLCIIVILVEIGFGAANINQNETLDYRLNIDVEPCDYILEFTPYFNDSTINGKEPFTFDGICKISIRTRKAGVNTITIHKQNLDIYEQSLSKKQELFDPFPWHIEKIAIQSTEYNNITHKYTIKLTSSLIQDVSYLLTFKYTGQLSTNMYGFYRSSYKDGNVTKYENPLN